ncbi:tetratricopeptide repeat protein [Chryseobacterium sp. SN22]|uniref:tetratricopeptide repeat protein n=1 Tax=Chryseobacterium sp. SN22 TaxID=2606431 RepID=UPI0011EC3AC3|nr:tetratricopeptide repeat protein [Chryseobacterium sp. SN22]KAA0130631.1 tetratricopeptide repeat protein [Chryseobacterium sp. SN22]
MIKKQITILILIFSFAFSFAQNKPDMAELTKELSENACKCVDSISLFNRDKTEVIKEIHECIDKQAGALQLGSLLTGVDELSKTAPEVNGKKQITLNFNTDKDSEQYKDSYNSIERYMMRSCESLKKAVNLAESKAGKLSKNNEAMDFYHQAMEASKNQNWKDAIKNYEKTVKTDPSFSYAWDNLGICYRRVGEYDKALEAYKKSLTVDPNGKMALQNIPIVYIYKKEFQKAINAYMDLDKAYPGDPEVYYGIGNIYFTSLKNNDKGLDYMCKAYRIYNQQKSPYRSDAESMISLMYKKMKEENKIERFNQILGENNIDFK